MDLPCSSSENITDMDSYFVLFSLIQFLLFCFSCFSYLVFWSFFVLGTSPLHFQQISFTYAIKSINNNATYLGALSHSFWKSMSNTALILLCGRFTDSDCVGLERILKGHLFQPTCTEQGHLRLDQVVQGHIKSDLGFISRDETSTTALGNMFQHFTTLARTFLLVSYLIPPCPIVSHPIATSLSKESFPSLSSFKSLSDIEI